MKFTLTIPLAVATDTTNDLGPMSFEVEAPDADIARRALGEYLRRKVNVEVDALARRKRFEIDRTFAKSADKVPT